MNCWNRKYKKLSFLILGLIGILHFLCVQENSIYPFDYSPRYQLRPYVATMLTELKGENYSIEENKMGYSWGVDFIYYLVNTSRIKPAVSLGLNITSYNTGVHLNYNDSSWTIDPGDDRVHVYEQGSISEKQQAVFISVPIQVHLDFSVSKRIGAYLSAGFYYSFISYGSYTSDVLLSRQGYYPRYNALIYDVDVEGSYYFYPSNKSMMETEPLQLKNIHVYIASFGVRYRISPRYSMFLGCKGLMGRNNISGYAKDQDFLVVSNQHTLNSTMAMSKNIKAYAWGIELGMNINLGKNKTQNIFQILERIKLNTRNR